VVTNHASDGQGNVDVVAIAVTVYAALHRAIIGRMQRHSTDAVVDQFVTHFVNAMAFDASEIATVRSHVHIEFTRCIQHGHRDVAMFHIVTAACVCMTNDAVLATWDTFVFSNASCNSSQIHSRVRQTGRCFALFVSIGLVVANEAVDRFWIIEGKRIIGVTVTGMALSTTPFVSRYRYTEVIDQIVLTVILTLISFDIRRDALPGEMRVRQHLVTNQAVAVQTGLRSFVNVIGKVALMQLLGSVSTTGRLITIEYINCAVTIKILFGVRETVGIKIPASDPVGSVGPRNTGRTGRTISSIGSIGSIGSIRLM
jgi:hypothetical protein